MAVRRIRNHGRWVWQARVAHRGFRRSAFRESRDGARAAQAELLRELKAEADQAEQAAARPATLRQLLEYYALDMAARGKGEERVGRVDYTSPAESQKVCTSSEPTSDCPIASSSKKIALIAPFSWFFGTTAAGSGWLAGDSVGGSSIRDP